MRYSIREFDGYHILKEGNSGEKKVKAEYVRILWDLALYFLISCIETE